MKPELTLAMVAGVERCVLPRRSLVCRTLLALSLAACGASDPPNPTGNAGTSVPNTEGVAPQAENAAPNKENAAPTCDNTPET